MKMRTNGAAYGAWAYARELKGNLSRRARRAMQMAVQSTTAHDPEAQAWYLAHVGEIYLRMGRLDEANREFGRAAFIFPDYPFARIGQGKVLALRGDRPGALAIFLDQFKRTPTLDLAARIGDLHAAGGDTTEAERFYQLAEDLAGPALAQTEAGLARFLAERDRSSGRRENRETVARFGTTSSPTMRSPGPITNRATGRRLSASRGAPNRHCVTSDPGGRHHRSRDRCRTDYARPAMHYGVAYVSLFLYFLASGLAPCVETGNDC